MKSEADQLRGALEEVFHLDLDPDEFRNAFNREVRRSLTIEPAEFSSLVFIEAWETLRTNADKKLASTDIFQAMDRVKSRLYREVKKRRMVSGLPFWSDLPAASPDVLEMLSHREDARRLAHAIGAFVEQLDPEEALIFDQCVLSGIPVQAFISKTGFAEATVYRRVSAMRRRFRAFISKPK
jgi:hypothetical protein